MPALAVREPGATSPTRVQVTVLGPFTIKLGHQSAGPWCRPPAKRLCELVMLSPSRRVGREMVREALFAGRAPAVSAKALSKALSLARQALSPLGEVAAELLRADGAHIWVPEEIPIDVDLVAHEQALRSALKMGPGGRRDVALSEALEDNRVLLEDEPYADWAMQPREALELLRQRARLELARDRARGRGQSHTGAVIEAWEACLEHDPACEEAAAALMRAFSAQGQQHLVVRTYDRCRASLEELGLRTSPALDEVRAETMVAPARAGTGAHVPSRSAAGDPALTARHERRLVTVLFAEFVAAAEAALADLEAIREVVGAGLAGVISEVEALGGTVASVSGGGLQALFGAPVAHEDDPERAVRAALRAVSLLPRPGRLTSVLRIGVETGLAVVGPIRAGMRLEYAAIGAVVSEAAAIQSRCRAGSVLVGPATRAATESIFVWGSGEQVAMATGGKPLLASYVQRPKPRARARSLRLGGRGPLVGRGAELAALEQALRDAEAGNGSAIVLMGEPGLGKTRLVQECRKRFMGWVGAGTGRLPLWLEGRCASYAATTPYGLYQHLVASWLGVTLEDEATVARALRRALAAIMGSTDLFPFLSLMMGLAGKSAVVGMSPAERQRAIFDAVHNIILRLAHAGPTVLVIEDFHWADPTSLLLTERLLPITADVPLLMVLTRRPDPDMYTLEQPLGAAVGPGFRTIELATLPADAERELARSFVIGEAGTDVIEAIAEGADGNPLFVEERFFSLLETGALVRDQGTWRLDRTVEVTVPAVLDRLVRSRVDRLSLGAQEAVRTASALGTEFPLSLLSALWEKDMPFEPAIAELCSKDLIQELAGPFGPSYRFRHALIQDATYRGLLRAERLRLHSRAADALEAISADRLEEVAAVLAWHLAAAGDAERAVGYFEMAGDHAAEAFANSEAISLFQSGLDILIREGETSDGAAGTAVVLWAKLAEVFWRTARRDEAREALRRAIGLNGPGDALLSAHLWIRLGRIEQVDQHCDAAAEAFDAAEELLAEYGWEGDKAATDKWLVLMVECRSLLHRMRNEPDLAMNALELAQPVLEAMGTPARKYGFYTHLASLLARQRGFRGDEEVIGYLRRGLQGAEESADEPKTAWGRYGAGQYGMPSDEPESNIAWARFNLGHSLVMCGELVEGSELLQSSLAMARRMGDGRLATSALVFLSIAALRRGDVEGVRSFGAQALAAAQAEPHSNDIAAAKAILAWVAWHDGRPEDVVALAMPYQAAVGAHTYLKWLALWPLVAVHLSAGGGSDAIKAARQMLDPSQQRMPDDLEALLEAACAAWDHDEPATARSKLCEALEVSHRLGFF